MGYYDDEKTALKYIRMAEGFDGAHLVDSLTSYLEPGANVLELGMGPGKDQHLLAQHFQVTGSDLSKFYIELFRIDNPDADLMVLDAVSLATDRRFDAIYSNKVLHHLCTQDLRKSLNRQAELLRPQGLICHSFWRGDETMTYEGLYAQDRSSGDLRDSVKDLFEVLYLEPYKEMSSDDSLLLIARKL